MACVKIGDRDVIVKLALIAALCVVAGLVRPGITQAATPCNVGAGSDHHGVLMSGLCLPSAEGNPASDMSSSPSAPPTKVITCGFPSSNDNGFWNPQCGTMIRCPKGPAFATLVEQNNTWVLLTTWCATDPPNAPPRVPTAADLRQQVLRLLPQVGIGSAWSTRALVNAQTVLWAETGDRRALGNVTVVGRQVALRIGFDHATWDFGDGTSDTTTDPGKPYTRADPCGTAQCPDYYGHTYTDTGDVTITLTVAWHAEFSLDGGATWTAVDPAPLTGPATTHDLTVVQARGIIVQNP